MRLTETDVVLVTGGFTGAVFAAHLGGAAS